MAEPESITAGQIATALRKIIEMRREDSASNEIFQSAADRTLEKLDELILDLAILDQLSLNEADELQIYGSSQIESKAEQPLLESSSKSTVVEDGTAEQIWDALEPGTTTSRDPEFAELIAKSIILATLHRRGFDFQQAVKFSEREISLAKRIGDHFGELNVHLADYRRMKDSKTPGERTFITEKTEYLQHFLTIMNDYGVVSLERCFTEPEYPEHKWQFCAKDKIKSIPDGKRTLIVLTDINEDLNRFIFGDWLNAYAYETARDQLSRSGRPFELFTKVFFKAPADVKRVASDFDVIGLVDSIIFCIECKSGRFQKDRGDFESITSKTAMVAETFDKLMPDQFQYRFYLVFDENINNEDEVRAELEFSNTVPLRPNQLRMQLIQLIDGVPDLMAAFAAE